MDRKKVKLHTLMKDLKKWGMETSEDSLLENVFEFALEREDEFLLMLKKKNAEQLLRSWLEHPVAIEQTDAVVEHDVVL